MTHVSDSNICSLKNILLTQLARLHTNDLLLLFFAENENAQERSEFCVIIDTSSSP